MFSGVEKGCIGNEWVVFYIESQQLRKAALKTRNFLKLTTTAKFSKAINNSSFYFKILKITLRSVFNPLRTSVTLI